MRFRASRVRWPEWLIGLGGVGLLAAMLLLPWFQLTLTSGPPGPKLFIAQNIDGWHGMAHAHWLLVLTILFALAALGFQARRRAPALPVTVSLLASLLAALTIIWLFVRVAIAPPGGRQIGGWLAMVAAAVIAYAGYASVRMEGIHPADGPGEIPKLNLGGETTA